MAILGRPKLLSENLETFAPAVAKVTLWSAVVLNHEACQKEKGHLFLPWPRRLWLSVVLNSAMVPGLIILGEASLSANTSVFVP